jgi:hypothetical protein
MGSLILDLQQDALAPVASTTDLLRKTIVVARKLGIGAFEAWAAKELSGYPLDADIPSYREIRGEIRAWNPYHGWIPVLLQDASLAERLSTRKCNQGIAELESLLAGSDNDALLHMPFPKANEQRLMSMMELPLVPTLVVSRTALVRTVSTARTMVLDWALRLEQDGILGEGLSFSPAERKRAEGHTYNITHFHGVVTGSQIQQFSPGAVQASRSGLDLAGLSGFIEQVRTALPGLQLTPDVDSDLKADLDTMESQLKSTKPKREILRSSLQSVRTVLEGAAGSLVASGLLSQLSRLLGPS